MTTKHNHSDILVIGSGIAGIQASLSLSKSGRTVHLIEKMCYTGGSVIKFEEVFSNMECSTCMVAPLQQELLQDKNIHLHTLSTVKSIKGTKGQFTVQIQKKARYVDLENCIGCNACFEPCPVSVKNEFEEKLSDRKAIYVPCSGALPNAPMIDTTQCLRFKGKKCSLCQEACMFDAIDFTQKDEQISLNVAAIITATGYETFNPKESSQYLYEDNDNVYTSMEFERLYASNGPTEGKILLKNGKEPKSVAIIHCVGRDKSKYCSSVCCLYSLKFNHYLKSKIPDVKIVEFYSDLTIPGKSHQRFLEEMTNNGTTLIHASDIQLKKQNKNINVNYTNGAKKNNQTEFDMIILAPAILPHNTTENLSKILGVSTDNFGFFKEKDLQDSSVVTSKSGIFVIGCAQGPKNIQDSIAQAEAAVGKILTSS